MHENLFSNAQSDQRYEVRWVHHREYELVDKLRISAYQKAAYFSVFEPSGLCMAADPEHSTVLGFWAGNHLAATLRLNIARTEGEAQALLGIYDAISADWLPAVVPGRGAVCELFRGRGIMPYLVTLGLEHARAIGGVRSGLASQAAGTPHQRTMLESGWTTCEASPYQSRALTVLTDTQLLMLQNSAYDEAVRRGLEHAKSLANATEVRLMG